MPFCTKCGSAMEGRFCVKCGAPADVPAAAPAQSAAPAAAAAQPARKKTSPLVWILVALVGLFVLVGAGLVGAGFFVAHKVKQAGFDPELMQKNPALAVGRMIAAANPDLEVLDFDEDKGTIRVRDRKTGKVTAVDFDSARQGRITFRQDGEETVTVDSGGQGGALSIGSGNETVQFGGAGDANVPSWIPVFPGAKVEGHMLRRGADGEGGAFGYKVSQPAKDVLAFYAGSLEKAGFRITSRLTQDAGDSPGGMLAAEQAGRTVSVIVSTEGAAASVAVTFEEKKK